MDPWYPEDGGEERQWYADDGSQYHPDRHEVVECAHSPVLTLDASKVFSGRFELENLKNTCKKGCRSGGDGEGRQANDRKGYTKRMWEQDNVEEKAGIGQEVSSNTREESGRGDEDEHGGKKERGMGGVLGFGRGLYRGFEMSALWRCVFPNFM